MDNDFGNVGQSPALIERDEAARLGALAGQTVQVFTIEDDLGDNRAQQRVMPVSYEEVAVVTPGTEGEAFYVRIPVTDHCGPSAAALAALRDRVPVSADSAKPRSTSTATAATGARRRSSPFTTSCAGSARTSRCRPADWRPSRAASAGCSPTA
jgi:hypothetical protein